MFKVSGGVRDKRKLKHFGRISTGASPDLPNSIRTPHLDGQHTPSLLANKRFHSNRSSMQSQSTKNAKVKVARHSSLVPPDSELSTLSASGVPTTRFGGASVMTDYQSTAQNSMRVKELRQAMYPRLYMKLKDKGITSLEVDL